MLLDQLIKETLQKLGIAFQEFTHPAVFTVFEARKLCPPMPGKPNKNLFFRDHKGKHYFLFTMAQDKFKRIEELGALIGVKDLQFASERRLQEVLKIGPGCVSLLALLSDTAKLTTVYIDEDLMKEDWVQAHPGVNTATLAVKTTDLPKFFAHTGHSWKTIRL